MISLENGYFCGYNPQVSCAHWLYIQKEAKMLNLNEELFLLCLHEDKVTITPSAMEGFPFWLGAAILADLTLMKRINIGEDHRMVVVSAIPTGEELLDESLKKIGALEGSKKTGYWIDEFDFRPKKTFRYLCEQLLAKGALQRVEEDFGWAPPPPSVNTRFASAKFILKHLLRSRVLAHEEPDLHEIALLSLLKASNKLELVFFKDERKPAMRVIDEMQMSAAMKDPVAQSLQEILSALADRINEE